ncbi:hypothetical protein NMG60_11005129 [Bertholletia excelsa]
MGGEAGGQGLENTGTCKNDNGESKAATTTTRIFVGGLGGTVTAEDLRNTFCSLGKVESVEIVRTKGRSFAYLDFLPSAQNSLSKLFSRYNGCMWKGGRLRLEKAREHYLLRLKQEWAEDAKLTANSTPSESVEASKNIDSPKKLNNILDKKKMEIRLFFPKLRKVKSLPFRGTGKHKYSFQHVEVPSLPIHFCDCEDHSDLSHTAKEAKEKAFSTIQTQDGGIDEKELHMMESVMSKLFERENIMKASSGGEGLVKGENIITQSTDDLLVDDNEVDNLTDEDNLVVNIVAGRKNKTASLEDQKWETVLTNEGAIVHEMKSSNDRPSGNMLKSQRGTTVPSGKKRKSHPAEETRGTEVSANPDKKGCGKKIHLRKSNQGAELELDTKQTNAGVSWSQKSAWRDLASERGNASFSISYMTENAAPPREEFRSDSNNIPRNVEKNIDLEPQPDSSEEAKVLTETEQSQANPASNKSARGAFWLQKSSWTQLVGNTNSSFSISQLLPGTATQELEQTELRSTDALNSSFGESFKFVKTGSSKPLGEVSKTSDGDNKAVTGPCTSDMFSSVTSLNPQQSSPRKNLQASGENVKIGPNKNQEYARNFTVGEICTFMRTDSSMREWKNAKAALSGSLKKKKNDEK